MATTADEQLSQIDLLLHDENLTAQEKLERLQTLRNSADEFKLSSSGQVNGEGSDLSPEQRFDIITSNLQEVLNPEIIQAVLSQQQRPLRIYWGTAPTGRPHCAYFVPILKIAEFLRAGCKVKILLADIHAFLDNLKAPIELVKYRAAYYKNIIVSIVQALGISLDKLEFVLGSSYQLAPKYQMDLLRACTIVSLHDARKAGAEVVKQVEDATLSGLIYPLMQSMDEQYLDVDVQFGGVDQRKIFTHAKELLPKLGYKERAHLMNPMVPGLAGGKMSASDPNSKIDVLEKPEVVRKKISKAFCVPQETENNGLLGLVQYTLLPASALKLGKAKFVVERRDQESLEYDNIQKLRDDYRADIVTPQTLKNAVANGLNDLLAPIQAAYEASTEWQELALKAYPPEQAKVKKVKKDKGSRYPGGTPGDVTPQPQVAAQPDGHVEGKDKDQVDLAANASAAINELKLEKKALEES